MLSSLPFTASGSLPKLVLAGVGTSVVSPASSASTRSDADRVVSLMVDVRRTRYFSVSFMDRRLDVRRGSSRLRITVWVADWWSLRLEDAYDALPLSIGRDETLTLYHALGKFLHNKREITDQSVVEIPLPNTQSTLVQSGRLVQQRLGAACPFRVLINKIQLYRSDTVLLKDSFLRNPLKMDAPEKILSQANAQGRSITDFLHENVLDFISDEAIDDAWLVISYLCEAYCLLANALCSTYPQTDGKLAGRGEQKNVCINTG